MTTSPIFFLCILLFSYAVSALYTDIYRVLDAAPCVLLLNKNGPVGCSAPEGGTVGDLYVIRSGDEMESFIRAPPDESKAVAMPAYLFNKDNTNRLHGTKKLKGLLLLYGPPNPDGWSPDTVNPNSDWGFKPNNPFEWNPVGDGLNFQKIPFPVYALSEDESSTILDLATNDTSYPRHAVQFNTFMHATKDAKTCLRRNQCIPLGGKSVWASFSEVGSKPIIMAMANIDSTAIFHDLASGADSTASGIVGLLGAALALQNLGLNSSAFVNDVIFAFWAGESWGYLGSKKFLSDIQTFECEKSDSPLACVKPYKPDTAFQSIKLSNIISAIELNQIGLTDSISPTLFVHQQDTTYNSITHLLQSISADTPLEFRPVNNTVQPGIPPSSLMSFLSANPNLPGVVVTDHELEYTNVNFHSHMDNGDFTPLSNSTLCEAATVLARTLYLMAKGLTQPDEISSTIQAPCAFLSELAVCLSSNFSCSLLDSFLSPGRPPVPSYYTGVFGYSIQNAYASAPAVLIYNIMALITSRNAAYNFSILNFTGAVEFDCKKCLQTEQCINGACLTTEAHFHDAISLGIDWDYSNDVWIVVNDSEPLWVESNWDSLGVELFRRANPSTEGVFLAAGIVEFIISLVAVYYAKRYFMRHYKIF